MPTIETHGDEQMTGPASELMTLIQVAEYLGMSERTIYMWVQQGRLPAFKLGTSWRFRRSEIDAWLENQRMGPDVDQPLFPASEPLLTRGERRAKERAEREAETEACRAYIESRLSEVDRDTVEFAEIANRFAVEIVAEAISRLEKAQHARLEELTIRGEKVKIIRRY